VIADATTDFAGPLAGVLAGMRWALQAAPSVRFIVTAACDTPFFPEDLTSKLLAAAKDTYPAVVLAVSSDQVHPVFGLWPVALADDLSVALAEGTRKVLHWTDRHPHFTADFEAVNLGGKTVDPFFNANTPEDLAEGSALLAKERSE
jgi:molybdopterin-guanine dinucleotide biosynthesis protein A